MRAVQDLNRLMIRIKDRYKTQMKVDRDVCVGCGACVNLCPRLAIRFIDNRSFIDEISCIECGTLPGGVRS